MSTHDPVLLSACHNRRSRALFKHKAVGHEKKAVHKGQLPSYTRTELPVTGQCRFVPSGHFYVVELLMRSWATDTVPKCLMHGRCSRRSERAAIASLRTNPPFDHEYNSADKKVHAEIYAASYQKYL